MRAALVGHRAAALVRHRAALIGREARVVAGAPYGSVPEPSVSAGAGVGSAGVTFDAGVVAWVGSAPACTRPARKARMIRKRAAETAARRRVENAVGMRTASVPAL